MLQPVLCPCVSPCPCDRLGSTRSIQGVTVQPPELPMPLGSQWGRDLLLGPAEVPRGGTGCFLHKCSLPSFAKGSPCLPPSAVVLLLLGRSEIPTGAAVKQHFSCSSSCLPWYGSSLLGWGAGREVRGRSQRWAAVGSQDVQQQKAGAALGPAWVGGLSCMQQPHMGCAECLCQGAGSALTPQQPPLAEKCHGHLQPGHGLVSTAQAVVVRMAAKAG